MGFFDKIKRVFSGESTPIEPEKNAAPKQQPAQSAADKTTTKPAAHANEQAHAEAAQPTKAAPKTQPSSLEDERNNQQPAAKQPAQVAKEKPAAPAQGPVFADDKKSATDDEQPQPKAKTPQQKNALNQYDTQLEEANRFAQGLKKSNKGFGAKLNALLANFRHVDEDFFDDLEETLIEADVGYEIALKLTDELRQEVKLQNVKTKNEILAVIVSKLVQIYAEDGKNEDASLHFATDGPTVHMFVGVNGVGKTTTIGKLAHRYRQQGKKVLLAAADTFRAGAIEQLQEWGKRVGVPVVAKKAQSDPAAVVFDAVKKAKEENFDILLVDTAGRLQNKVNLMNELAKMKRVITRELPDAPQEVLLALDATTGQNALTQAKQFKDVVALTGLILTKLDGTARGGIILAIRHQLKLPVKLVGLGEHMDDLRDFDAPAYMYGLFSGLVDE